MVYYTPLHTIEIHLIYLLSVEYLQYEFNINMVM